MAEEIDDDVLEVGSDDGDSPESEANAKPSRIKQLLSNRIVLISIISVLVILLATGAYFIFFTGNNQPEQSLELSEETTLEQEMAEPPQSADNSSGFLSAISDHSNSPDSGQSLNSDNTDGDKPSRLSQISKGMVEAAKTGGIATDSTGNTADTTASDQIPPETPESKLLTEKVAELELENQKLKQQISDLEIQIKLYKNSKRVEDLSVPVDKLAPNTITGSGLYNDGLINDFSSDYSASPYADDEMTPKPTWGDVKPDVKK
ncbi:MAG: hypothetical protein IBX57_06695 [Gammaproteobacteria bacterium]|nr:hypothetical protein [Gammaproteobacteria bacterium]